MGLLINCGNFNVCIIKWFYKIVFILIGKKLIIDICIKKWYIVKMIKFFCIC